MSKRKPTPMSKLHRVVQVPSHVRNGKPVRGHTRRVLLAPPYVPPTDPNGQGAGGPGWMNTGQSETGW
jgi:hypothetical protein